MDRKHHQENSSSVQGKKTYSIYTTTVETREGNTRTYKRDIFWKRSHIPVDELDTTTQHPTNHIQGQLPQDIYSRVYFDLEKTVGILNNCSKYENLVILFKTMFMIIIM